MTFQTVIQRRSRSERAEIIRQTVTRTVARIHVRAGDDREWLFEQNVLDSRRFAGTLIDHSARALIFYSESDLRNVIGVNGWANALTLGFDHTLLGELTPSSQSKVVAGLRFQQHVPARKDSVTQQVWWNRDQLFPINYLTREGDETIDFAVESFVAGVDTDLLTSPSLRFPNYQSLDLAEWLER